MLDVYTMFQDSVSHYLFIYHRRQDPYTAIKRQTNTKTNKSGNTSTQEKLPIKLIVYHTTDKGILNTTGNISIKMHMKVTGKHKRAQRM